MKKIYSSPKMDIASFNNDVNIMASGVTALTNTQDGDSTESNYVNWHH